MVDSVRPPVAIRIVRPYESEDELLEHELETIGRTSVLLIGAHPRPTGVILRFEVALASGATVLRGEGRVLAHKEDAFRGQPGLTLRFTRLDPRSKAVVDRATSMREARPHGDTPADGGSAPSRTAKRVEGAVADALTALTPMPSIAAPPASGSTSTPPSHAAQTALEEALATARATAREKANATARANARRTGRAMDLTPPPWPIVESPPSTEMEAEAEPDDESPPPQPTPVTSIPGEVAPSASIVPGIPGEVAPGAPSEVPPQPIEVQVPMAGSLPVAQPSRASIDAPPDRAELLARLRERAGKLAPERVEEILATRS